MFHFQKIKKSGTLIVALHPHSSRVAGSILSLGCCLCGFLQVLLMPWVGTSLLVFSNRPRACWWLCFVGWQQLPLGVMRGYVYAWCPGCILLPHTQYSQDRLWSHSDHDHDKVTTDIQEINPQYMYLVMAWSSISGVPIVTYIKAMHYLL